MVVPSTDIEKAVEYAELDTEKGLVISPRLVEEEKQTRYKRLVLQVDGVDALMRLQDRLEMDMPYLNLCPESDIKSYFQRWKIPIENKTDLTNFAKILSERVEEAATSNPVAETYLQERKYQQHLREVPAAVAKLEGSLREFKILEEPFEAVIRYVYDAVSQGFYMDEKGGEALEPYENGIFLKEVFPKHVEMAFHDYLNDHPSLYICPDLSWKETTIRYFRSFNKTKNEHSDKLERFFVISSGLIRGEGDTDDYHIRRFLENPEKRRKEIKPLTVKGCLELMVSQAMRNNNLPRLNRHLKTIFNLPKYMHNYAVRASQKLSTTLDSLLKEVNLSEAPKLLGE